MFTNLQLNTLLFEFIKINNKKYSPLNDHFSIPLHYHLLQTIPIYSKTRKSKNNIHKSEALERRTLTLVKGKNLISRITICKFKKLFINLLQNCVNTGYSKMSYFHNSILRISLLICFAYNIVHCYLRNHYFKNQINRMNHWIYHTKIDKIILT